MTRSKMACGPSWILDKALQEEIDTNWKDANEEISENDVQDNANVI